MTKNQEKGKISHRSEHSDQVRVVMHIRAFHPKVIIAAVPNGAAVTRAQRLRLVAEGLLPGFPDLIVCEPRGLYHGLFVEMKSEDPAAVVSAAQTSVHARLRHKGYAVTVARGYMDAVRVIVLYLTEGVQA